MRNNFIKKNIQNWENLIKSIFKNTIPAKFEWTDKNEIIRILNLIGQNKSNHTFFPTGGGLDLTGAEESMEDDCINLYFGRPFDIVKPLRLIFHSFDDESEWFYFRLETQELKPTGVYKELHSPSEELVLLDDGRYIQRKYWDIGKYEEKDKIWDFRKEGMVVTRHFKGSFVIFAKASTYNRISSTYDGRHNRMTDEQFENYIGRAVESIKKRGEEKIVYKSM